MANAKSRYRIQRYVVVFHEEKEPFLRTVVTGNDGYGHPVTELRSFEKRVKKEKHLVLLVDYKTNIVQYVSPGIAASRMGDRAYREALREVTEERIPRSAFYA